MFFDEHDGRDDYKIWLSQEEVQQLLDAPSDSQHRLAFELGVRCGFRSDEIVRVTPNHVKSTEAGHMIRIKSAKSHELRQTPLPEELATRIRTIADVRAESEDDPLIDVSTRTLRRWIDSAGDQLADETGDEMWLHVTMHDLRRTWATSLKGEDVDAMIVCDWGGWNDLETFLEHYRGKFEAQRRQREKVDWL